MSERERERMYKYIWSKLTVWLYDCWNIGIKFNFADDLVLWFEVTIKLSTYFVVLVVI